jgi:hypothetical protein
MEKTKWHERWMPDSFSRQYKILENKEEKKRSPMEIEAFRVLRGNTTC